ncbi:MAG: glycosyltransferase [Anaerolineae bacterium]|nr:glycosyltransferase [Anaerolineae bacterium]
MMTLNDLPAPPPGKTGWPWTEAPAPFPAAQPDGTPWPRVTVVTPSYNQAAFIEETARSVLLQGYPNLEYFVVDGGSADGSVEIIERYTGCLAWWVSEPDGGQSDAINKGFARATGDIIAWLNSDDVYLPDAIPGSVKYLLEHPEVDLVYGDVVYTDVNGNPLGTFLSEPFNLKRLVTDFCSIPQPSVFLRRAVLDAVGPLRADFHYSLDLEWWVRIASHGYRLAYVPVKRAKYRLHGESKTIAADLRFRDEDKKIKDFFFAQPDLMPEQRAWQQEAYSNEAIYRGRSLAQAGDRKAGLKWLWRGLWMAPLRPRTALVLLMMIDAVTGLNLRELALHLRNRLARLAEGR